MYPFLFRGSCALIIAHFRAIFKAFGVYIQTCMQKAITLVLVGLQKSMTYENALEFHEEFISWLIEDILAGLRREKLGYQHQHTFYATVMQLISNISMLLLVASRYT